MQQLLTQKMHHYLQKKVDLVTLKSDVNKLNVDKLKTILINPKKISDAVDSVDNLSTFLMT